MSSSLSYRLARHSQAQAYVVWSRRRDAAAYEQSKQWDDIDISVLAEQASREPVDYPPDEYWEGWEERDKKMCELWEQEQAVIHTFFRAVQIPFFTLAAVDAKLAYTEAAVQTHAVNSARFTAPVPTAPGGRAVSDLCLTPRLLAQRPNTARAARD